MTEKCRKPYLLSGATDLFCAREGGHPGQCAYAREFRPGRRGVALTPALATKRGGAVRAARPLINERGSR